MAVVHVLARRRAVRKGRTIRPRRDAPAYKKETVHQPTASSRATIGKTDRAKTRRAKEPPKPPAGVGHAPDRSGLRRRRDAFRAAIWNAD